MKLFLGDCLDIMRTFKDKSVDLIITDPPYGIGIKNKVGGNNLSEAKDYKIKGWDESIPEKIYFDEMIRISKNQIIFGGNYFTNYLNASPCWIVWDKLNSGNFADFEMAWTSFKTAARIFKYRWNGMLQGNMKNKEKRFHPTQKPLPLMEWIISNYTEDLETIFDPFMGSGTTGVAAMNFNRKFVGCEKEKVFFEIAKKRIESASKQLSF